MYETASSTIQERVDSAIADTEARGYTVYSLLMGERVLEKLQKVAHVDSITIAATGKKRYEYIGYSIYLDYDDVDKFEVQV